MGLNSTPYAERIHIGFFGRRNAGKSSVVNAVTGQEISVVSDVKGTTTDPVYKSMELLPMGPVVVIDTPGFDDEGALGELRIKRTRQILNKSDCAVLVIDQSEGRTAADEELISLFKEKQIPYIVVYNKCDLAGGCTSAAGISEAGVPAADGEPSICVSALKGSGIHELKERIASLVQTDSLNRRLVGDLLSPGDLVVLVIPIDSSAPKGRLILPQQQMIRDILEAGAVSVVTKDTELSDILDRLVSKGILPAMVITDSQAFEAVGRIVPAAIPLTSFSILMARYKGFLETAVLGVSSIGRLEDGDRVLICEGCTHHRQCGDIGSVKIPNWIRNYTGKELLFDTSSGNDFPEDLSPYRLVIHCGGCMLNEREIHYRQKCAEDASVPFTNYGITIAFLKGILEKSLGLFPCLLWKMDEEKEV